MTSELRVDNLKGSTTGGSISVLGEGTSATTNLQQGLCKAWVNFDGSASGAASRDSFNLSAMTDNGTGDYTVAVSNAFSNDDFCSNVSCGESTTNPSIMASACVNVDTSSVRQEHCFTNVASNADAANCYTAMTGDLA